MGVAPASVGDRACAERLATALSLPLLDAAPPPKDRQAGQLQIWVNDGIPELFFTGRGMPGAVRVGFEDNALASRRRAGHNELLGKAVGWRATRPPRVLDATGGFGRDAFVLADLGCQVVLCERLPVMAQLLAEALARVRDAGDDWLRTVSGRMHLHAGDARGFMGGVIGDIDVVYLDPMFPEDRKAAPGKEMQVLQALVDAAAVSPDPSDDAALLAWALAQPVARVVVKRPRRAPSLAGRPPGHSVSGRSVRFDVYPCP